MPRITKAVRLMSRIIADKDFRANVRVHDARAPNSVWEVHTLKRLFQAMPIDCVFDVGANRGGYATMLRQDVGFQGHIVSFEPVPDLAQVLRERAETDSHWRIEEVALAEEEGTATFNIMANDEFSSLRSAASETDDAIGSMNTIVKQVTVRTEPLKLALERLRGELGFKAPFLKLDTQGHDFAIVAAAQDVMQEFVALQSELAFVPLYEGSATAEESLALYRQLGFTLAAFIPNNAGHFPRLLESDCLMVREDRARETAGTGTH